MGRALFEKIDICPEKLRDMYRNGVSCKDIALYFGCSLGTIRNRASALGICHANSVHNRWVRVETALDSIDALVMSEWGYSPREIATHAKVSIGSVRRYLKDNGVKLRTISSASDATMHLHGTRLYRTDYREEIIRDADGLVTQRVRFYGKNTKVVIDVGEDEPINFYAKWARDFYKKKNKNTEKQ